VSSPRKSALVMLLGAARRADRGRPEAGAGLGSVS
jgi:hypothetical protein